MFKVLRGYGIGCRVQGMLSLRCFVGNEGRSDKDK